MQTFPIQSPYPFNNRTVYVQRTPAPVVNRVSVIPDSTATLPIQPRQFLQPPTVIETPQPKNHFVIYRSPCEKCFSLVPWWCWVLSIVIPLALIIPLIYLSVNSLVTDKITKYLTRNFTRLENRTHVKLVPCIPEFIVKLVHLNETDLKNPLCADNDQNRYYEQVKELNGYANGTERLLIDYFFLAYFLSIFLIIKISEYLNKNV